MSQLPGGENRSWLPILSEQTLSPPIYKPEQFEAEKGEWWWPRWQCGAIRWCELLSDRLTLRCILQLALEKMQIKS